MKICCISDLHGRLPKSLPKHDLLVIAGDICPLENHQTYYQRKWLREDFQKWWASMNSPAGIGCWGNHDVFAEVENNKSLGFEYEERVLAITDLMVIHHEGLNIFLSSFQNPFGVGWSFNLNEVGQKRIFDQVPDNIDIIVSHGPVFGYGDRAKRFKQPGYEDTGSKALLELVDRVKPKLVVTGHIHSGYGKYQHNETVIVNASIVNEQYKMVNEPIIVEIEC